MLMWEAEPRTAVPELLSAGWSCPSLALAERLRSRVCAHVSQGHVLKEMATMGDGELLC